MEKYFSLFRLEQKLRSLLRFSGCSAIVFRSGDLTYAYHKDPQGKIKEFVKSDGEVSLGSFLEDVGNTKKISFRSFELIFIEPSPSMEERSLDFMARELEEDIQFASIVENVFQAGLAISSKLNLNPLLHRVMSLSEEILDPEVTAVMLLDEEKRELYWEVSRGEKSEFFREKATLPVGVGIGGHVALLGESVLSNDVQNDPRWNSKYDQRSGFCTRSMICVPLRFKGKILGVIEVINKKDGEFTSRDLRILEILASQAAGAIANARIHKDLEDSCNELKVLDKAKERIINHLAHELRTPLAIVSGTLDRVYKKLQEGDTQGLEKTIKRGQRNLNRLLALQDKIDDILNERSFEDKDRVITVIESAVSLVEELEEEESQQKYGEVLKAISDRLEDMYGQKEFQPQRIDLTEFLDDLCDETVSAIQGRHLEFVRNFQSDIILDMDRNILRKACTGLLKNAVENTPDEGRIEINTRASDYEIYINFHDFGVGINEQNQKMILGGFFHTLETDLYSSKAPYKFNAGGSGSDLLRIKVLSARHGFSLGIESERCKYILRDSDICPGNISTCHFIKDKAECLSSGGSVFSLKFPVFR